MLNLIRIYFAYSIYFTNSLGTYLSKEVTM